jgi:hypothetical protein
MMLKANILGLLSLSPAVLAHYKWPAIIVDGEVTGDWEYVRENTNNINPVLDLDSEDVRCNEGGLASGPKTKTITVEAGSQVRSPLLNPLQGRS